MAAVGLSLKEQDVVPWYERSLMMRLVVGSILHGGHIELCIVSASVHDWCNKGRGMCCPVCGMVNTLLSRGTMNII